MYFAAWLLPPSLSAGMSMVGWLVKVVKESIVKWSLGVGDGGWGELDNACRPFIDFEVCGERFT